MRSRTKKILAAALAVVGIYALTPFVAGLLKTYDRRGPKLFVEAHHEILYTLGYYMAGHHHHDGKPRVPFMERSWFYGFTGEQIDDRTVREKLGVETVYFPNEAVSNGAEYWYPTHLEAMKEPSLFQQSTNEAVEQFRFLWLRSFHKPIAARIRKDSAGITLRVVRLSGAGGYAPGHIERDESFSLIADQWDVFAKLLEKSSFWDSPSVEQDINGEDGSQWILEGQAAGKYHVVDRWSPSFSGDKRHLESFEAVCRYLLMLSKEEIPKKDIY